MSGSERALRALAGLSVGDALGERFFGAPEAVLGTGPNVLAQDTVPFAQWAAAESPDDFEATFWRTLEGLGDRDTTCAIACGLAGIRCPPPSVWLERREPFRPASGAGTSR